MRILLFESDPPKFYKEISMQLFDSRLIPVNMYAYVVESNRWIIKYMYSGRAGTPSYDNLNENEIPKEVLAMALLLE